MVKIIHGWGNVTGLGGTAVFSGTDKKKVNKNKPKNVETALLYNWVSPSEEKNGQGLNSGGEPLPDILPLKATKRLVTRAKNWGECTKTTEHKKNSRFF